MKHFLLMLVLLSGGWVILFGSGCALLEPFQEQAADKAAAAMNKYCEQTSETFRTQFREEVNQKTNHSIVITCN